MTNDIVVVPATAEDLLLLRDDPTTFTSTRGWSLEPGYDGFPRTLAVGLDMLGDGVPPEWATHLFVHADDAAVVGIGGFKGTPVNGNVEIGYSVAPGYRNRGVGTRAAALLVEAAARRGVATVTAHTLAGENASTKVLTRLGFVWEAELKDPDLGAIWRWERSTAA